MSLQTRGVFFCSLRLDIAWLSYSLGMLKSGGKGLFPVTNTPGVCGEGHHNSLNAEHGWVLLWTLSTFNFSFFFFRWREGTLEVPSAGPSEFCELFVYMFVCHFVSFCNVCFVCLSIRQVPVSSLLQSVVHSSPRVCKVSSQQGQSVTCGSWGESGLWC